MEPEVTELVTVLAVGDGESDELGLELELEP